MAWKFECYVSFISEQFTPVAVKSNTTALDGKVYKVEQKSLGWFATIDALGIKIHVGDTEPVDIGRGSKVTVVIHDWNQAEEAVDASSNS